MEQLNEKRFYEVLGAVPDVPAGIFENIERGMREERAVAALTEQEFYTALGAVPDVPAGILENVERSVRQSGVKRRISVAACLLLALIIPALLLTHEGTTSVAYADNNYEAMDELLYAFEFMSGGFDDAGYMFDIYADDGGSQTPAALRVSEESESTAVAKTVAKKGDGQ